MTIRGTKVEDREALPEDGALLSRIANKDRAAFDTLYRRYYRRLFHFVLKLVRVDELAEEAVDDVMFAVWTSADTFQGRSSVSTWLFGIAYRQALKSITRDRRQREWSAGDEHLLHAADEDPSVNPEIVAMDADMSAMVQQGLDRLSEQHRAVVELTALGYSYSEISDVTDCCASTVKTRMFYARRQLKRFMDVSGASLAPNGEGKDDEHLSKRA